MSKSKNTTASNLFATVDHHLGRIGTPVAAAAAGGGLGLGVAWAADSNMLPATVAGVVVGVVVEEGARAMWCDDHAYAEKRIALLERDAVQVAAKYF